MNQDFFIFNANFKKVGKIRGNEGDGRRTEKDPRKASTSGCGLGNSSPKGLLNSKKVINSYFELF